MVVVFVIATIECQEFFKGQLNVGITKRSQRCRTAFVDGSEHQPIKRSQAHWALGDGIGGGDDAPGHCTWSRHRSRRLHRRCGRGLHSQCWWLGCHKRHGDFGQTIALCTLVLRAPSHMLLPKELITCICKGFVTPITLRKQCKHAHSRNGCWCFVRQMINNP